MTANSATPPLAVIFGCAGLHLSEAERAFFRAIDPAGFILFARNVESPPQVRALVADLRDSTGRNDALVLIDQEGGRVARLTPPHWRATPAASCFGDLAVLSMERARRAAWLNSRLIADDLAALGISVDCLPVLDMRVRGAHDIIGDRSYGADPDAVAALGLAACNGLMDGGVLPVLKHIPGHGRAMADSHHSLPVVAAERELLEATDFEPFRQLAGMPLAMTAHIVYKAVDPDCPATVSPTVIADIIRGSIGFDGLLMTDDISMKAMAGSFRDRASEALVAGCDIVLHCNGDFDEMAEVAAAARPVDEAGMRRYRDALAMIRIAQSFDRTAALAELADLVDQADGA